MFDDFMRAAFMASGIVAVLSGAVGYFLVLRGQTFAGHALAHVGFTGATGAAFVGLAPFWGMVGFTVLAGVAMGALGERLSGRDVAIGMMLSLALGMGVLFLHFYTSYAAQATALLFGNVLGVDDEALVRLAILAIIGFAGLAAVSRPLLFASLQPELAEARGVPVRAVSAAFLVVVAVAVAECAQIVGVLLVFTLMVGPAAAAQRWTNRLGWGIGFAVAVALAEAWGGLVMAYITDWPTTFWITMLSGAVYFVSLLPLPALRREPVLPALAVDPSRRRWCRRGRARRMALATPTPMIEPISVWELDAGRPNHQAEVPDDGGDQ